MSRPLVSRVLARDRGVNAGTLFGRLEPKLVALVERRGVPFFHVEAVPVEAAVRRAHGRSAA